MSLTVFLKELKRNRAGLALWCAIMAFLKIMGMAFYPLVAKNEILENVMKMFEGSAMQSLIAAFGKDVTQLSDLLGFYVTYNSVYALLLGSLFAILYGARIIAQEEREKTADFLLSRPVTRGEVFNAKALALFFQILILNAVVLVSGLIGLEAFKLPDARKLVLDPTTKASFAAAFRADPAAFAARFGLDENTYVGFLIEEAMTASAKGSGFSGAQGMDMAAAMELMDEAKKSPEDLFRKVREHPEEYMATFGIPEGGKSDFLKGLETTEMEYSLIVGDLAANPARYVEMFERCPLDFLGRYGKDKPAFEALARDFGLSGTAYGRMFVHYRMDVFLILSLYSFLLMLMMGSLGVFISMLIRRGKAVTGSAVGVTLSFYFVDTVSRIGGDAEFAGYLSPFKFVNVDVLNPVYGLDAWRVAYFLVMSVLLSGASLLIFRKKDILV